MRDTDYAEARACRLEGFLAYVALVGEEEQQSWLVGIGRSVSELSEGKWTCSVGEPFEQVKARSTDWTRSDVRG
jgi:hypothetical protein